MFRTLTTVVYAAFLFLAVGLWSAVVIKFVKGASWHDDALAWAGALGPALAIFLAGALGFWGVIHRQKADAREARKQREAEQDRETQRRLDEARALAGALQAEIAALVRRISVQRKFFQECHNTSKPLDRDIIESATMLPSEIYQRNIERLTLLPPGMVFGVVTFYVRLGEIEKMHKQTSSLEDLSKAGPNPYESMAMASRDLEEHGNKAVAVIGAFLAGEPSPYTEVPLTPEPRQGE